MRTNYEFHQLKTKLSAATTPPVQEMGHVLARDPAAPSQFPPPPHLLPVFCEPSVSNGMLPYLVSKGFPSCQKQCEKDQSKPLFLLFYGR